MEREINKGIKLMPRDAKLGLVCDLTLPTLEVKEIQFKLEIDSREEDPTEEFRKNRTKSQQNRRDKNALF